MPTWEQAEKFIGTTGLAAFLVVCFLFAIAYGVRAAWHFLKPWISRWFEKQIQWFDSQIKLVEQLIDRLRNHDSYEEKKRKAFLALGRAVHAASPDEKAAMVKRHIDEMHEHFDIEQE
jgi:glutamate racemase